ncbi:MAG: FeoB-associated Cys-rich membrane protein [Bacteroidota bacterium]
MIENLVIFIVFALALAYLGNMVWKQFSAKNTAGCAKGCGACGNIDFNKIEQQIAAKEKQPLEKIPM